MFCERFWTGDSVERNIVQFCILFVLINCRKINHHAKKIKSPKPKWFGTKSEKKIGQAGPG